MRYPQYLAISCGSCHLVAAHLRMNASGRCELLDYRIEDVSFDTTDPLIWLKAASERFAAIKGHFPSDLPVGYALPGHLALTKYLKIPQVSERRRPKIVAYEARQNIPYPIGEVTWSDYLIDQDDLDFEEVIAAVKTDIVEALSRYGKSAKMDPVMIEPAFASLLNAYRFNYPENAEAALLVSVGARSTDLAFFDKGKFFSRNVSIGGDALTREIAEKLALGNDEAEQLKRQAIAGEPMPTSDYEAFSKAANQLTQRLKAEITRTATIAQQQGFEASPKICYVTGGGSLLPDFESRMNESLGMETRRFDPLRKVVADLSLDSSKLESDKSLLGVAVGASIGRFIPDPVELDLLPRSILWQRKFRKQQPYFIAAGLVACAAVALPLIYSKVAISAYKEEIHNLDTQIVPLRSLNQKIANQKRDIEALQEAVEKSSGLLASRSNWVLLLNDLQQRMISVEDVWLDHLEVDRWGEEQARLAGNRLSRSARRGNDAPIKLRLQGRLLDVRNPLSTVSDDSYGRVKALLESFKGSKFIAALEDERFDNSVPGILKFDFTLVIDEAYQL